MTERTTPHLRPFRPEPWAVVRERAEAVLRIYPPSHQNRLTCGPNDASRPSMQQTPPDATRDMACDSVGLTTKAVRS